MFYINEYIFILIFFIICVLISVFVFFLNFIFINKDIYIEKHSAYECGFNPFGEARNKFDIRFYLEVILLFPWCLTLHNIGNIGFFSMIIFLFLLLLGFYYEWKKNALDWS